MNEGDLRGTTEAYLFGIDRQGPEFPNLNAAMLLILGPGMCLDLRGEKRCTAGASRSLSPRVDSLLR